MNTPSSFQGHYPLSSKKLWKKLISQSVATFFLAIVFGFMLSGLSYLILASEQTGLGVMFSAFILSTLAIFAFINLLYGWYVSAYIKRYYYDANEQFLTIQKGVFAPSEIHVPYGKIQDVYVDQDILDRMMGLYDVHVASATRASGIEAHIDGVDEATAESLKNFLLNKIQFGGPQAPSGALGMSPSMEAQAATAAPAPQGPQAGVFNSARYPINPNWLWLAILTSAARSIITTIVLYFYISLRFEGRYTFDWTYAVAFYTCVFIFNAVQSVLWRMTFSFEFLPQFILVKDGVIRREEKHVPYRTLQNVSLKRNIAEQALGLCTVVIENAAAGMTKTGRASRITLPGQPLEKGTELVNELNRIIGHGLSGQGTGL